MPHLPVFRRANLPPSRSSSAYSHAVAPTSGYGPHRPPYDPAREPSRTDHSHGVSRPSDASAPANPPASCHPRALHPQGFSPSRRVAPHRHAQLCFKLETPLGFCSPGGFPHRQVRAARHFPDALLAFAPRILKKPRMWTRGVPTMLSGAGGNLSAPSGLCSDGGSDTVHWTI